MKPSDKAFAINFIIQFPAIGVMISMGLAWLMVPGFRELTYKDLIIAYMMYVVWLLCWIIDESFTIAGLGARR